MPSYLGRRLTLGCRRYLRLATPWPSLPPSRRPDSRRLGSDLISSDADLTEARETLGAIPLALAMRRCSFYKQSDAVFAGRLWMLCLTLRWPSLTPRASLQKEFSTKRNEDPGPDTGHTDQILEYRGSCPMYQSLVHEGVKISGQAQLSKYVVEYLRHTVGFAALLWTSKWSRNADSSWGRGSKANMCFAQREGKKSSCGRGCARLLITLSTRGRACDASRDTGRLQPGEYRYFV